MKRWFKLIVLAVVCAWICCDKVHSQSNGLDCTLSPPCNESLSQVYTACAGISGDAVCPRACQLSILNYFQNTNCGFGDYYFASSFPALQDSTLVSVLDSCGYSLQGSFNPTVDPGLVFDGMWEQMHQHYPFFCMKGVDWFQVYRTFRPQINVTTSEEDLWGIVTNALATLDDAHVYLVAMNPSFETPRLIFQGGDVPPERLVKATWTNLTDSYYITGLNAILPGLLEFGRITSFPRIGYLRISSFSGYSSIDAWTAAWDTIMGRLSSTNVESLIIDVRYNTGGQDIAAALAAGRFTPTTFVGLRRKSRIPSDFSGCCRFNYAPLQTLCVTPQTPNFLDKEIIILTSTTTLGAAESFVLMMRNIPSCRVTVLGQVTEGSYSDILNYRLPNGWIGMMPYQVYYDAQGASPEGIGQVPDVIVSLEPDRLFNGVDNILQSAISYLVEHKSCQSCQGNQISQ